MGALPWVALQIKNLNNALSTLKIEAEILEGHHTKALQAQNQAYLGRIQELEREHRTLAPLMREMVSTLQAHGLSGALSQDFGRAGAMKWVSFSNGRGPTGALPPSSLPNHLGQ